MGVVEVKGLEGVRGLGVVQGLKGVVVLEEVMGQAGIKDRAMEWDLMGVRPQLNKGPMMVRFPHVRTLEMFLISGIT